MNEHRTVPGDSRAVEQRIALQQPARHVGQRTTTKFFGNFCIRFGRRRNYATESFFVYLHTQADSVVSVRLGVLDADVQTVVILPVRPKGIGASGVVPVDLVAGYERFDVDRSIP